jgi:hypothetical protein
MSRGIDPCGGIGQYGDKMAISLKRLIVKSIHSLLVYWSNLYIGQMCSEKLHALLFASEKFE